MVGTFAEVNEWLNVSANLSFLSRLKTVGLQKGRKGVWRHTGEELACIVENCMISTKVIVNCFQN